MQTNKVKALTGVILTKKKKDIILNAIVDFLTAVAG